MDNKNKIGLSIAFVFLIGVGVWAIVDPSASDTWIATGRKAWLMEVIIAIWGRPLGAALVVLGGLALAGLFVTKVGDDFDFS